LRRIPNLYLDKRAERLLEILSERIGKRVPEFPPEVDVDSENESEEDEEPNPKDRIDPKLVNPRPTEALSQSPAWVTSAFDNLIPEINNMCPDIWWKNSRKLSFYSPHRNFMRMRFSRTGIRIRLFTRGKDMKGVEPIINKNRGGALWGRMLISQPSEVQTAIVMIAESWKRMNEALAAGEATAWWALRNREEE
jgi:hypothetical protein